MTDCSTDGTLAQVRKYTDNRISGYSNTLSRGTYWNRNRAVLLGGGEFFTTIDGDVCFYADKLQIQVSTLGDHVGSLCALSGFTPDMKEVDWPRTATTSCSYDAGW